MANNKTLNISKIEDLVLGSDDPAFLRQLWHTFFNELKDLLNDLPVYWGNGTPEGSVTASAGVYVDLTGKKLYVKESGTGNTGWVVK